jgi:hypothetical protein
MDRRLTRTELPSTVASPLYFRAVVSFLELPFSARYSLLPFRNTERQILLVQGPSGVLARLREGRVAEISYVHDLSKHSVRWIVQLIV